MHTKVSLIEDNHSKDTIYIHPIKAKSMNIKEGTGTLKFGTQINTVAIIISEKKSENELTVSSNIVKNLKIPVFCEFDFFNNHQNLIIGPFIGIVAARSKKVLEKRLQIYSDYLFHYDQLGGAIIVFSLDEVSKEEQTIKGYIYNPVNKKWEKSLYKYPSSLFLRIKWFGSKWQRHFESFMGDTIFNNFNYNKWEFNKILKNSPELTNHVPKTILYKQPSDILSFLEENHSVYLKPIKSSRGNGIIRIDKLGMNKVQVKYSKGGKITKETLNNRSAINEFFKLKLKPRKYIIQKSIELISKNNGLIDFRIYLTKDNTKAWKYFAIFSKRGIPGEIVSNICRGGKSGIGLEILKDILALSEQEVKEMENSIKTVALQAVEAIENSGVHFGNTGIDIGIDKNKRVWIIEVQSNTPGQQGFLHHDKPLYYNYLNTIMQYAKKLAGF